MTWEDLSTDTNYRLGKLPKQNNKPLPKFIKCPRCGAAAEFWEYCWICPSCLKHISLNHLC